MLSIKKQETKAENKKAKKHEALHATGRRIVGIFTGDRLAAQLTFQDGSCYTGDEYRSWRGWAVRQGPQPRRTKYAANIQGVTSA